MTTSSNKDQNLTSTCPVKRALSKVGRPKSEQKRLDILYAASHLFLTHGFSSTSMDLVATQAGVSKQTVYSHFNNKEALFTAVIGFKCAEYQLDEEHMSAVDAEPRQVLIQIGKQIMGLMLDEQVIAMHRVVIGEIATTPRVAELFFQAGPEHGMNLLGGYLQSNTSLDLTHEKALYWSCMFFNMLKGDFHLRSLLGLPYSMPAEKQTLLVTMATDQLLLMIESEKKTS